MYYYLFGNTVNATSNACLDKQVFKEFWYGFCSHCSSLEIKKTPKNIFAIGNPAIPKATNGNFTLNVSKDGVYIIAENEKNLIRGFITLMDKIKVFETEDGKEKLGIEYCNYTETPPISNRMIHYCVFPDTKLFEIERFFRLCGALKYTHIVLEFWGMLKYDCLPELGWKHAFTKQEIKPLIKTVNDLGIEIIPMFNHWGHATGSRLNHGKHVVLNQNPRLQYLFSDDGWVWNIDDKRVQALLRSVRKELTELCGDGEYFHLGCDEPYNFNLTENTCDIVTDYLNELCEELKKDGRRPIIWGDMFVAKRKNFNPNNKYVCSCPNEEIEKKLLKNLDRSLIIADWQYWVHEAPVETTLIFKNAGFDTILCPWDELADPRSIDACCDTVIDNSLFGVMHTTWHTLTLGMPDITKCSELCLGIKNPENSHRYYGPRTASLLRKVYFVNGDYKKSGWAEYEIVNITR